MGRGTRKRKVQQDNSLISTHSKPSVSLGNSQREDSGAGGPSPGNQSNIRTTCAKDRSRTRSLSRRRYRRLCSQRVISRSTWLLVIWSFFENDVEDQMTLSAQAQHRARYLSRISLLPSKDER